MQTNNASPQSKTKKTLSLGSRTPKKSAPKTIIHKKVRRTPLQDGEQVSATPEAKRHIHSKTPKVPPKPLIATWIWMWKSGPTPDVCRQGKARLLHTFGHMQAVIDYVESLG